MNLRNITLGNKFIERNHALAFGRVVVFAMVACYACFVQAWEIDFSHHQKNQNHAEQEAVTLGAPDSDVEEVSNNIVREPATLPMVAASPVVEPLVVPIPSAQKEIVILNTENGFVPKSIALKAGTTYTLHVVNVNEKLKNVSFVMDSFNQFHSTYFGEMKTFTLNPTTEGTYSYQCPENGFEGQALVMGTVPAVQSPNVSNASVSSANAASSVFAAPSQTAKANQEESPSQSAPQFEQPSARVPATTEAVDKTIPVQRVAPAGVVGEKSGDTDE